MDKSKWTKKDVGELGKDVMKKLASRASVMTLGVPLFSVMALESWKWFSQVTDVAWSSKTRAFHLMVLVLVRSRPESSCMSYLFCRMHIYDMYVQATTLVTLGGGCHPTGRYVTPTLFFSVLFELSLDRFKTVSLKSLGCLLHF